MSTKISNIAQLPEALQVSHAAYFDNVTGDVLEAYWHTANTTTSIGHYTLYSPTDAPYVPPEEPPEPTEEELALATERAAAEVLRAAAERDVETALEVYLAIEDPDDEDREPLSAAELRLADCMRLVGLLGS